MTNKPLTRKEVGEMTLGFHPTAEFATRKERRSKGYQEGLKEYFNQLHKEALAKQLAGEESELNNKIIENFDQ